MSSVIHSISSSINLRVIGARFLRCSCLRLLSIQQLKTLRKSIASIGVRLTTLVVFAMGFKLGEALGGGSLPYLPIYSCVYSLQCLPTYIPAT